MRLGDFAHKHWDRQAFTRRLTRQQLTLALRQMPTFTIMLRTLVRKKTGS